MLSTLRRPYLPARHGLRLYSSLNETMNAVVIGGGSVGSSIAYHLAKRGMRGLVLLEAGTVGSSNLDGAAPGFTSYMSPVARYNRLMVDSQHLYAQLADDPSNDLAIERPGTLRLGVSERRLAEFHYYQAKDATGRTRLLGPDEAANICPFLDKSKVTNALYSEGDGHLDKGVLSKTLSSLAEKMGATIMSGVSYRGARRNGGVWEVETDRGTIRTNNLINATSLHARDLAAEVGVMLPLVDITHHFSIMDSPSALANSATTMPAVVHHEHNWYIRPYRDKLIFGAFEEPSKVEVAGQDKSGAGATPEQKAAAVATLPGLGLDSASATESEGRLALSPDGLPLIGPVRKAPGYWVAAGFFDGVATAGGVGRFIADWIMDQEPPFELGETCASRYDDWLTPEHKMARARESYSLTLNWSQRTEDRQGGRPCSTRISGVYSALLKEGAKMSYRNGWEAAAHFGTESLDSARRQYETVVNNAGIIDVAYKGLIEVRGPEREKFLDMAMSFSPPETGYMSEGFMLTPQGRVLSHISLLHHEKNFLVTCSPEQENRNLRWLETMAFEGETKWDVEFQKVSAYLSKMKVTGPRARELLGSLTVANLMEFPYKGARVLRLAGVPSIVIGFCESGEEGFGIFHSRAETLKLYGALMREGQRFGAANFGVRTHNTLRMEKGIPRDEAEFSLDFTAVEAGVGDMVEMKKDADFVGRVAMAEMLAHPSGREIRLCRMSAKDAPVPRGYEVVRNQENGQVLGHVTSGCYSFAINAPLFFAFLNTTNLPSSAQLGVDFGTGMGGAEMLSSPPRCNRFAPKAESAAAVA